MKEETYMMMLIILYQSAVHQQAASQLMMKFMKNFQVFIYGDSLKDFRDFFLMSYIIKRRKWWAIKNKDKENLQNCFTKRALLEVFQVSGYTFMKSEWNVKMKQIQS